MGDGGRRADRRGRDVAARAGRPGAAGDRGLPGRQGRREHAAWEDAYREHLRRDEPARAARCGFWLSMALLLRGEMARGGGWVARSQRLVADAGVDCAERGFLMLPTGLATLFEGGAAAAYAIFEQAAEIGERFAEPDLVALARHGQGQALVRGGDRAGGLAVLDEVLASVAAGEVGPIAGGLVYCAVIETCHEVFDLRRVREWTTALSRWCAAQPELVLYRGQCLVHRSEVLQLAGEWPDAVREAQLACERCRHRRTPRWAWRCTSSASCTACAGGPTRPRRRTPGRAPAATTRSPGWPSCASARVGSTRRSPPSAAPRPR